MPKPIYSARFLRIAQNIESICGKRLQRAKGGSADEAWYANCVYLAKRAQATPNRHTEAKLWNTLDAARRSDIWLKAAAGKF